MSARTDRAAVAQRANDQCEYCGMQQRDEPLVRYQVEHIIAKQHGGSDDLDNLALACSHCNCKNGPNLAGIDPLTSQIVELFHPRRHVWNEHFEIIGPMIAGLSPCGRATVHVLGMNDRARTQLRRELEQPWKREA